MTWIDVHNHLHSSSFGGDVDGMVSAMRKVGVTCCVVNATEESDWAKVSALTDAYPGFVWPAFGIHPWKAETARDGWQSRLCHLLEKYPQASVGEVGLDQWVERPDFGVQRSVFSEQLRIAREMERPITIHCLKAWQPLFDAFEREPPPDRFLMHSYGGSIELAERLVPLGAYFSFSGYFLHARKAKVLEVFRKLPRDRVLIETDAPDMLPPERWITHSSEGCNHPANLKSIAEALSDVLGIKKSELAEITTANARRLFDL